MGIKYHQYGCGNDYGDDHYLTANEVTIPDCFMDSDAGPDVDAISDWLSDMSGWLHDGFEIVE